MTRKRRVVVWVFSLSACLLVAGLAVAAVWAVRHIPGVARLVYGDPPTATAIATLRATFTPLPVATLTPMPTATSPTVPSTPVPSSPAPTAEATATDQQPTAAPTDLPPTQEPPTATPLPPPPRPTPRPQWIAFETHRGSLGDYEIYVMTTDGDRLTNLTNSWADDVSPVWSPDGRRIAFVSFRDTLAGRWNLGPGTIYLLDFDPETGTAGNLVRLTDGRSHDGWPTWSPDGKRIAFQSDRTGNWDIWIINVDGSGLTQLTHSPADDEHPDWSPDGKKIAFSSDRSGNWDVWVIGADGSNPMNLTNAPRRDRYPMWSPDGQMITFNTNRNGDQEIYLMNANGSNQRNVSNSPQSTEGLADWSPDGKRLVLYSNRSGNKEIYIVDLASGQWTNLSNDPASDEFCTWSP